MSDNYEKQAAGVNGLGVDDRFPWQGAVAPSGSWQLPNLSAQQQQPNIFQQQLTPPAAKADVAGIQGALQKFRKMGAFSEALEKEALGLGDIGNAVGNAAGNFANKALQSPLGQGAMNLGGSLYNKLPEGIRGGVANQALRMGGLTNKNVGSWKYPGFTPNPAGRVHVDSSTMIENDNLVEDRITTQTPGKAGSPWSQVSRGFMTGHMPTRTFQQGAPVANQLDVNMDNITGDKLIPQSASHFNKKGNLGALSPLVSGLLSGAGSTAGSMLVSEAVKRLLGSKKPTDKPTLSKPTLSKQSFDALRNYQKQYPKYNWADHSENLKNVRAPYEGWSGAWKGITGLYAPGQMSSEKRRAVQNYLMGKNKQYPLPKGSLPWHMRDTGERTVAGFHVGNFEPTKPKPRVSGGPNLSMGRQLSASEPDISLPPQGTPPTVAREAPLSAKDLTPPPVAPLPSVASPPPSVKPVLNSGAGIPASTGKAVGQLMKGVSGGSAGAAKLPASAWSKRSSDVKFRNLMSKHAEQDNSTDSRSAVGESKITYKTNEDDHATGSDAWESLSKFMKTGGWPFKKKPTGPQVGEIYTGGTLLESEEDLDAYLQPMMAADIDQFLQENPNASFEDFLASPRGLEWMGEEKEAKGELKEAGFTATGTKAWDSLSTYMKSANETFEVPGGVKLACDSTGLTPYQLAFAVRVHEANLSPQQIIDGVEKVAEYMGEEYAEELRDGLDKIASLDKEAFSKLISGGLKWLRGAKPVVKSVDAVKKVVQAPAKLVRKTPAANQPVNTAYRQTDRVADIVNRGFQPAKSVAAPKPTSTVGKMKDIASGGQVAQTSAIVPNAGKPLNWMGGNAERGLSNLAGAGRMAGGAMTGQQMAGSDAPWWQQALGAAGGAAFGRSMPNMGHAGRAAGRRAAIGAGTGYTADMASQMLLGQQGTDYGKWLSRMGFASPLVRGQKIPSAITSGKYNPLKFLAGKNLPNLSTPAGLRSAASKIPGAGLASKLPIGKKTLATAAAAVPATYFGAPIASSVYDKAKGFADTAGQWYDAFQQGPAQYTSNQFDNFLGDPDKVNQIGDAFEGQIRQRIPGIVEDATGKTLPELREGIDRMDQLGSTFSGLGESLSGVTGMIDPILEMVGMDPSKMNPMMKVLLMAGGGLGIHGLLSGNKSTGIGGMGMMALPLIMQWLQRKKQTEGGAEIGSQGAAARANQRNQPQTGGVTTPQSAVAGEQARQAVLRQQQQQEALNNPQIQQ